MSEVQRAFVGLGGNLGDVETTLVEALWAIDGLPQTSIRAQSALYRSKPWGRGDQPDFLNGAVELQTRMTPRVLLEHLLAIEERFGRVRAKEDRWGPRTLDLDLLLYGDHTLHTEHLQVPHPGLAQREFVLFPLQEIAPELAIPGQGSLAALCAGCPRRGLTVIDHD